MFAAFAADSTDNPRGTIARGLQDTLRSASDRRVSFFFFFLNDRQKIFVKYITLLRECVKLCSDEFLFNIKLSY